jgi:ParB family chromosome partitioning protein
MTQEQVADRVGKGPLEHHQRHATAHACPTRSSSCSLEGDLDMGHARAILGLAKANEMVTLARAVVTEKLTVRETEARVKALRPGYPLGPRRSRLQKRPSPEAKRWWRTCNAGSARRCVWSRRGQWKGSLEIEFFSYEDLERIIHLIKR